MSSSPTTNVHIAPATPDDVPTLIALIRALAEYEKLTHQLRATPEALREHLFGPRPYAEAAIARVDGKDFDAEDPHAKIIVYDLVEKYLRDTILERWSYAKSDAPATAAPTP